MAVDRLKIHPEVLAQQMGDEMVLVHLETERIHTLNATAARIWALLQQGCDVEHICDHLAARYDVDDEKLRAQIDDLLEVAEGWRLVVRTRD